MYAGGGNPRGSADWYVALFEKGEETQETRKAILREQRELLAVRIAELQKTAELLDYKIAKYDIILVEY
jgi:DNA-binding transcriptional MerR regulator